MRVGVRRALAGSAAGLVVFLWLPTTAAAETLSPTPVVATASPTTSAEPIDTSLPAPDNSDLMLALGGAGAVALIAAAVVFLRRR